MNAYEIVLFLIVALIGIALVVLGIAAVTRHWIKSWWNKPRSRQLQGPVAIILGVILLVLASVLLIHHFPDTASEAVTAIGTVSGDVITAMIAAITLYAVTLLRRSVNEQTMQLKITAIQNVNAEMLKIDRWLADHPEYVKALESKKDEQPIHGKAVAEVYADFIAQVVDHAEFLPDGHSEPWENYFRDIIQMWPQLEKFMNDHPEWYLPTMKKLLPDRQVAG